MSVTESQPDAAREHVFDRHAPFVGKGFNPLSRHLIYAIPTGLRSPVATVSVALNRDARRGQSGASANEIPLFDFARSAQGNPRYDGDSRHAQAVARRRQ